MTFIADQQDSPILEEHIGFTSKKDILGWYSCGFSNEVFSSVSITTFIPVLLEQLVRSSGVLLSDKSTPCLFHDSFFAFNLFRVDKKSNLCVIYIHGIGWIDSYSFSLYVYSIASFFQVIVIISISSLADYGKNRKMLFLVFSIIGGISSISFIFINRRYLFASFLFVLSSMCFSASTVLLNAFLPGLCRNHPSVLKERKILDSLWQSLSDDGFGKENVSKGNHIYRDYLKTYDLHISSLISDLSSTFSSRGIAIGYLGAIIFQIVSIMIIFVFGSGIKSFQIIICATGLWWLVFTIPVALWLRSPLLPSLSKGILGNYPVIGYILYSWKSLIQTFLDIRKYKKIMLFLIAWFFISDAYSSISSTTVLFVKSTLHISPLGFIIITFLSTLFGVMGAFLWPYIARSLNFSLSQVLVFILFLSLFIPVYGILGLFPISLGLKRPIEIYILSMFFGFLYGGIQGYSRALFGKLCPENYETRFYALYSITEKSSSFFGPALVGYIFHFTHNMRYSFFFLLMVMTISIFILFRSKISDK
ncbi:hypothetical protein PNEG_02381 [Pneumocystis murina B123]|uniref:Autophagy-related protein n=1 Tax=Pneumocystis murina (strain B123) TaxID=1069680 RepID=M7PG51_PNEMU|nr:hypothetical protein PNEG_02381 [Pneumocystis murina B123]EMR09439.1 hypothetical protein PNEG_02381 [Pneumocystis murina B123]